MTDADRRGSPILGGVETAVAAARGAASSATRSAFHRGLAQTFTPPPPRRMSSLSPPLSWRRDRRENHIPDTPASLRPPARHGRPRGRGAAHGRSRPVPLLPGSGPDREQPADGLGEFSYQWIREETDIAGARAKGSTYRPVAADIGSKIKVRVSWTDGNGTAEALTSAPTKAVTAATLVSNLTQSTDANRNAHNTPTVGFTTGPDDYQMTAATVDFHSGAAIPGELSVELWSANGEEPGSSIATLANPTGSLVGSGVKTFSAPDDTKLDANTTYFIRVHYVSSFTPPYVRLTDSDAQDDTSLSGWSIADKSYTYQDDSWVASDRTMKVRVEGFTAPEEPAGLSAKAHGTALRVTWSAPSYDGGSTITGYSVQYRLDGDDTLPWTDAAHSGVGREAAIGNLPDGTYDVRVAAVNSVGTGDYAATTGTIDSKVRTDVTLVSNDGQPDDGGVISVTGASAQKFTTGANALGYNLASIGTILTGLPDGTTATVTLRKSRVSGGKPGGVLFTLIGPLLHDGSISPTLRNGLNTFIPPDGATLEPNTDYFFSIQETGGNVVLRATNSTAEDSAGLDDWSIANDRYRCENPCSWTSVPTRTQIQVKGSVVTLPTLVSNLDKDNDATRALNSSPTVGFTTGPAPEGYVLTGVKLRFHVGVTLTHNTSVQLWSANGSEPGSRITNLSNPSSLSGTGVRTFKAPNNTILTANTTYFIRAHHESTSNFPEVSLTDADGEDSSSLPGWSIGDQSYTYQDGSWVASDRTMKVAVEGSTVPYDDEGVVWTGIMTAERISYNFDWFGYTPELEVGALDDTTFFHGNADHTIDHLAARLDDNLQDDLVFGLAGAGLGDVSDLALRTGGKSFDFSDAAYNATFFSYTWLDPGLDWEDGDAVALQLVIPSLFISEAPGNEAPGEPTSLSATPGDGQVTLSWTAPASAGGADITGYEYEQNGSGTWTATGATATSHTVTGLTNGQVNVAPENPLVSAAIDADPYEIKLTFNPPVDIRHRFWQGRAEITVMVDGAPRRAQLARLVCALS